ncbi:MAG: hypothetical protein KKI14_03950 [Nanoarchaeota archaeon]|nr:hypothetical protein [Nanoarchaeota archaeon]
MAVLIIFILMRNPILISLLLAFSGLLPAILPTAHADTEGSRIEIYGKTTVSDLLINGISNSGTLHFGDNPETAFVEDYNVYLPPDPLQAAYLVPVYGAGGVLKYYEIRGWAWSDNLGWVSFYCDRFGKNTGAACGPYKYVTRITAGGEAMGNSGVPGADGFYYSWAWNQALGWISMTDANHAPGVITDPAIKAGYGVTMSIFGSMKKYAWSQTVGWLNFDGVQANIKTIAKVDNCATKVGVCVEISTAVAGDAGV